MTGIANNPWARMALNNAWANATLYGAIRDMPDGAFTALAPGFFPSLAATMNHIYEVDLYYIDALEAGGMGRSVYDRDAETDPARLAGLQADVDMRFAGFCSKTAPEALSETRETERPDGLVTETVGALILHLVQHQIHHRGQAHVQLSAAGRSPPQLDDFYLAYGRAPSAAAYW